MHNCMPCWTWLMNFRFQHCISAEPTNALAQGHHLLILSYETIGIDPLHFQCWFQYSTRMLKSISDTVKEKRITAIFYFHTRLDNWIEMSEKIFSFNSGCGVTRKLFLWSVCFCDSLVLVCYIAVFDFWLNWMSFPLGNKLSGFPCKATGVSWISELVSDALTWYASEDQDHFLSV